MEQQTVLNELIEILTELQQEEDLHHRIQSELATLIHVLKEPIDMNLRVDRCRSILDTLDDHPDVDMYTRTQLWNVNALLEQL